MAPPLNRRPGYSRRAQYGRFIGYVIAVAGAAAAAVMLVLGTFDPPAFAALRAAAAELTAPVSSGGAAIGRELETIPDAIASYFGVRQENAALRAGLRDANALLTRARSLSYDNARLKRLLRLRDAGSDTVVAARLVSSSASSTRRFALLDAGSWQGVREGQPVEGPEGLIGRVLEAGPNTARVLLLSDPESVVPVRRTRDGIAALASGRGDGLIDIRAVDLANVPFVPGDAFVSTGTGGIYPPGIPVARAIGRSRDAVIARPFAEPDLLDVALVRRMFMPLPAPARGPMR